MWSDSRRADFKRMNCFFFLGPAVMRDNGKTQAWSSNQGRSRGGQAGLKVRLETFHSAILHMQGRRFDSLPLQIPPSVCKYLGWKKSPMLFLNLCSSSLKYFPKHHVLSRLMHLKQKVPYTSQKNTLQKIICQKNISQNNLFPVKSSQVCFTIRFKVDRQETAIRQCSHLGQLHLLAILYSYRHKLSLVMEPQKKIKKIKK